MRYAPSGDQMCDTCERLVHPAEQGQCAFCRMSIRGDNRLLAHPYLEPGWIQEPVSWLDEFMARCRLADQ